MHRVISLFPDIVDNERYTVEFEKKENFLSKCRPTYVSRPILSIVTLKLPERGKPFRPTVTCSLIKVYPCSAVLSHHHLFMC